MKHLAEKFDFLWKYFTKLLNYILFSVFFSYSVPSVFSETLSFAMYSLFVFPKLEFLTHTLPYHMLNYFNYYCLILVNISSISSSALARSILNLPLMIIPTVPLRVCIISLWHIVNYLYYKIALTQ